MTDQPVPVGSPPPTPRAAFGRMLRRLARVTRIDRLTWRGNLLLIGSLVVGFAIRLWWIIVSTPAWFEVNSDPYEYLSYARQLSDLSGYSINGHPTDFFSGGWPIVLTPMAYVSRKTQWFSVEFGASVVSLLVSVLVIYLSARLAEMWFGRRARNLTAWFVALAPGLIGVTSTPLTEVPYTALLLAILILLSKVLQGRPVETIRFRWLVLFGAMFGYLVLIRGQALTLIPVAAGLVWYYTRSLAPLRRAAPGVLLGLFVVLTPMAIRNGLAIGYWSPTSTGNAGAMCMGHSDGSNGGYNADPAFLDDCHWGAPHGVGGLEAKWATQTQREAVRWALGHPRREVELTVQKTWLILGQDRNAGSISYLTDLHSIPERWVDPAWRLIEGWRTTMLVLAGVAIVRERKCRQAIVLWLVPLATLVTLWAGAEGGRMNLPFLPFLAMFAAALLTGESPPEPVGEGPDAASSTPDPHPAPEPQAELASARPASP